MKSLSLSSFTITRSETSGFCWYWSESSIKMMEKVANMRLAILIFWVTKWRSSKTREKQETATNSHATGNNFPQSRNKPLPWEYKSSKPLTWKCSLESESTLYLSQENTYFIVKNIFRMSKTIPLHNTGGLGFRRSLRTVIWLYVVFRLGLI